MPETDEQFPARPPNPALEAPSADSLIGQAPTMMRGGVIVAHTLVLVTALVGALVGGRAAIVTALLAGLTVTVLLMAGQYLQMILVQRADLAAMAGVLAGFGVRVAACGAALAVWLSAANRYPMIRPWWVVAGCCAATLGWLAGVLFSYRRLHVPIYDEPSEAGSDADRRPGS